VALQLHNLDATQINNFTIVDTPHQQYQQQSGIATAATLVIDAIVHINHQGWRHQRHSCNASAGALAINAIIHIDRRGQKAGCLLIAPAINSRATSSNSGFAIVVIV
jgi:hypothetical protein